MPDLFIPLEQAENDLLSASAFIAERIKSSDGHAEAMAAVIPQYLSANEVDLAAELANAIDDPYSRDKLLTMIAEKCAMIDDEEYALQLVEAIDDHGLQSQALERIGMIMASKGRVESAEDVAGMMSHPDFVYAGVAVHQTSVGNHPAADEALSNIEYATARVHALQQIAASALADGKPDSALAPLERAVADTDEIEHEEERLRALCEIGSLYTEAGHKDLAIRTFDKAKGLAEALQNVHRDTFLATCALGFLHAGSSDLADRALDEVRDKTQISAALLDIARHEWTNGEQEDAIDTLEESAAIVSSQRESEIRDSRGRNELLAAIAAQMAAFGKSDRAIEIAIGNPDPAKQVNALTRIAHVQMLRGDEEEARHTLNMIPDEADRLAALLMLSDARTSAGDTAAAAALLDEAFDMSDTIGQPASRATVLIEIAARSFGLSKPEKAREASGLALQVIAGIRDESRMSTLLTELAELYRNTGLELTEADKAQLSQMVRRT